MLRFLQKSTSDGPQTSFFEIAHNGEIYKILLKPMESARRYTLRVRTAKQDVVLTMPACGSLKEARSFTERHAAWIGARIKRLPDQIAFIPGARVPLRGLLHEITHRPQKRGSVWLESEEEDSTPLLCVNGGEPHIPRRIKDYLVSEARRDFETAVRRHSANLGLPARKITMRDTTSRWGSCSASGSLNFSWRLIMAPNHVLDYLAAHEVAHLRHLNHSPAFWAVLATLSPDVSRAESWLKTHGGDLLRYGPKQS